MEQRGQGVRWWVLGSAALAIVGAFGPWVKALGISVGGIDGSNDGWLVVAAAATGGLLFHLGRGRSGGGWALVGGVVGAGVTLYDRSHLQHAINKAGALGQALVQVGWGLNLALVASISMAIGGAVAWRQQSALPEPLAPAASPPPFEPPPRAAAPTPPPD
jgi:hypothetical protein